MAEMSDLELLDALGVDATPKKKATLTPKQERIIAGFEEIQKFVDDHNRLPTHGDDGDIFERLYAVRLDQIRKQQECRELVVEIDRQGLLGSEDDVSDDDDLDDDALLAQLGVEESPATDVTKLQHVKSRAEVRAAEEIANRTRCEDFDTFKSMFEAVQKELDSGVRITLPFRDNATVNRSDLFILSGQKVYVAEVGEEFVAEYGRPDSRLRVIYDNGTESDILRRSLQRALNKDEHGRRISNPHLGGMFSDLSEEDDLPSGTIYVLRSKSEQKDIQEYQDVLHKIGVTGGSVKDRIANAPNDPTFLMAEVEIVATYDLFNINRSKLENIIHRFFDSARLKIEIMDRFGKPFTPREWFLVPLFVIEDAVSKIKDGTIGDYVYDVESAGVILRN